MTIRIRHILCPIDFSVVSRRALDHAIALARWYDARLSVLHVHQLSIPVYRVPCVGPEALQPIVLTDLERQQLLEQLDTYVVADRAATALEIETLLDETVNVPEAILSRVLSTSVDLIALGTHGRSGFERLVLGSIAEKVLRKACCPVLTVPPHAPGAVPRDILSMQRILCPVDFSRSSGRALEYAASLAQEAHARLSVLHVLELPADLSESHTRVSPSIETRASSRLESTSRKWSRPRCRRRARWTSCCWWAGPTGRSFGSPPNRARTLLRWVSRGAERWT